MSPKALSDNDVHQNGGAVAAGAHRRFGLGSLARAVRVGWPTIVFDMLGPIVAYQAAVTLGAGQVPALVWSAVPPAFVLVTEGVRHRRVNGVGTLVLVSLVLALVFAMVGGTAEEVVSRDAYGNLVLAVLLVGSLLPRRRPLLYHLLVLLGKDFTPGLAQSFARQWAGNRHFRRYLRLTSLLLGSVLVVEAVLRLAAARWLPIEVTVAIFQVEGFVFWSALMVPLVMGYRRAVSRSSTGAGQTGTVAGPATCAVRSIG